MCKKQTSVSHSSTESGIISLDAGLRMDGIPALDLWDMVTEVFHSSNQKKSSTQQASGNRTGFKEAAGNCVRMSNVKLKKKGNQNVEQLSNLDHVTTNATSSQCEAQLCVFEDNGAVIKMIISGRSPMMRHASRTHWVALDRLFDRINLDPKIQIKYVDTKNQLADLLTKESFSRDEWCNLLRLFNIMFFFSIFSCSHVRSIEKGKHQVEENSRK